MSKNNSISKTNIMLITLYTLYKIVFEIFYIMYIPDQFGYYGSTLSINIAKMMESYGWFILILIILPKSEKKFSSIVMQLHFIIIIIPILNIYWLKDEATIFLRIVCTIFILQILFTKYTKNIKIPKVKGLFYTCLSAVVLISIYVAIYLLRGLGLPKLTAFNLSRVYEVRGQIKLTGIINYLVRWQAMLINPFLILVFLKKRKYLSSGIVIILHLMLFLWTGHKTFLLILPVIILSYIFVKKQTLIKLLTSAFIIIMPISQIAKNISLKFDMLIAMVHRFFITPATNQFYYYDFFKDNSKLYWSNGLIGKLLSLPYQYELPIGHKLGELYYQRQNMNVTTGYLADGFSNAGIIGVLLYTIIFVITIKVIDSISKTIGVPLTTGILIFIVISLTDTGLLTTLLTSGMLLAIVLIYSYNSFMDK